ncbi:CGCGG family rSAM-modified RiPP protein [Halogeometricum borinquense]|uniref:CGCGG family rSAM-modified RiPP protein n=2 Tax=Halogeometricum borinquense TaxID=60847 RepID=A0A6C0UG14_9EURY|nr:CGCGG family rSAM-modified RiPP protein [Halogeometricum borinquense]
MRSVSLLFLNGTSAMFLDGTPAMSHRSTSPDVGFCPKTFGTCSAAFLSSFVASAQMKMHSSHSSDHDHDEPSPVTDRTHDNSWSANLEQPQHAADVDLVVSQAIDAIEHTEPGNHVNLVTHGDHGHPSEYLFDALDEAYGDDLSWEHIQQCGCGGHVTRVYVE